MAFNDESFNGQGKLIWPLESFFGGPFNLLIDIWLFLQRKFMAVKIPNCLIEMLFCDFELKGQDIIFLSLLRIVNKEPYEILIDNDHIVTRIASGILE